MQKLFAILLLAVSGMAWGHGGIPAGPDSHAPIGMGGDHTHRTGELMWSYRYTPMSMDTLVDGTRNVGLDDVLSDYRMAPLEMNAEMHMLGVMYAPSDTITLSAMLAWMKKDMTVLSAMGLRSYSESSGISDTKLSMLYTLPAAENRALHLNFSVSVPTGSIDEENAGGIPLGYSMQLGSGTWDVTGGATWRGIRDRFSWGTQLLLTTRIGTNDNGYTLGDRHEANAWTAWRWNDEWSSSLRLNATHIERTDGADIRLDPTMSPGSDASVSGGDTVSIGIGTNFRVADGRFQRHRIAAELVKPIYENLSGPRLSGDWTITFGWQYDF